MACSADDESSPATGNDELRARLAALRDAETPVFQLTTEEVRELFSAWACPGNPAFVLVVFEPAVTQAGGSEPI